MSRHWSQGWWWLSQRLPPLLGLRPRRLELPPRWQHPKSHGQGIQPFLGLETHTLLLTGLARGGAPSSVTILFLLTQWPQHHLILISLWNYQNPAVPGRFSASKETISRALMIKSMPPFQRKGHLCTVFNILLWFTHPPARGALGCRQRLTGL